MPPGVGLRGENQLAGGEALPQVSGCRASQVEAAVAIRSKLDGQQLDRPGRAAVAAGAITWATATARLVRSGASVRWSDASSSSAWNVPDRQIRLTATHEALVGGVNK